MSPINVLNSSKTECLDAKGEVTKVVDENTRIDISKSSITIARGGYHTMTGTILSTTATGKLLSKKVKAY